MSEILNVGLTLINNKLGFEATARNNPAIRTDYIPPLGDDDGYYPLELFLISLATCSGGTVASLIRKFHKTIDKLEVRATGAKKDTHPRMFESIELEFSVVSPDASAEDIGKAVRMSEETYCPVWAMLKGNVEVKTVIKLNG